MYEKALNSQLEQYKLVWLGAEKIKGFINKVREMSLLLGLFSLMFSFVEILLLIWLRPTSFLWSWLMVGTLLLTVSFYPIIKVVFLSFWMESLLIKLFATFIGVYSVGGVRGVNPQLSKSNTLLGKLARRYIKEQKFSKENLEVFETFLNEWDGSLESLVKTSKSI